MWHSCFFISFLIVYCPDKHETQNICDKAVDDCLAVLKFIPNWFVTNKTIIKSFIYCFVRRRWFPLFWWRFDKDDPNTVIFINRLAWQNKFKKRKEQKKISGELMPIAWHPRKQWNFCMPDEEKEIEPIFTEKCF